MAGTLPAARLLLAHELRLSWRTFRAHFRLLDDRALLALVAVLMLVMHWAAWSTGTQLAAIGHADAAGRERAVTELSPGVSFIMLLMVAQTLNGLTQALYSRSDLDLVLSSPFSTRIVFAVRILGVALGALASAALFVLPVADVALLYGGWRSLALAPMLAATALVASAASLAMVMGLFAWLGPRRTRLAVQIVATFAGGGFMLWLQVRRFLPALTWPSRWGGAGAADLWLLPARAAAGEPVSLIAWIVLGLLLFGGAVFAFAGPFARGIAQAAGLPASGRVVRGRERPFRAGLAGVLRDKEWRLIRRDPWLLSQLLLQVLYMTPMLFMLMGGTGAGPSLVLALAPMIVVVSYQVSASMTWLSLSAEDAPDLLASAPVTASALQGGKLAAVAELCLCLAGAPLLWLALLSPLAAAQTALLAGVAVGAAMLLSLWHARPAARSRFAARHRESKLLALMEMVMSMLMGVTAALLVAGSPFLLLPLGLAALVLLVNRPRRQRSADRQAASAAEARQ